MDYLSFKYRLRVRMVFNRYSVKGRLEEGVVKMKIFEAFKDVQSGMSRLVVSVSL